MECVKISDITKSVCTGLNPRKNFTLNTKDANNYYVTVKEITSNKVVFSESTDKVNDDGLKIIQNRSHLEKGDVLFSGIGTIGKVAYIDFDTNNWNCSESVFILKPNDRILGSFLFYVLQSQDVVRQYEANSAGSIMKGVRKSTLVNITFPLPPLAMQKEIVEILDTFTGMIDNLQKELEQRQKQFEYYRKSLLCKKDGTAQKVKEFAELKAGKAIKASELSETQDKSHLFPCFGGNGIRGYIEKKSHFGDYAIIGRQGALCGCVNWAQNYFYATEHAVVVTPKGQNNSRFLYYLFCEADLNQYKSQGAQPGLAVTNLNELQYYIPSLDKQQEIVDKLDTFEALISNIKQEIELRQKQYEYYREKLLAFE